MKSRTTSTAILGILLVLTIALLAVAPAAQAADRPLRPSGVLLPVKMGTSPVLRNMPVLKGPAKLEPGTAEREVNSQNAELPENVLKARPAPSGEDSAVQRSYGPNAMPPAIVNFDGVGNIDGVLPPDTNGDVGVTYYVQWVNLSFAIFNKSDGSVAAGPFAGNTLWTGFGGSCENNNSGDPIVLYDQLAGRWFMSQFTGDNHQCIAVSQTGDPTGSWYLYDYVADASMGDFPDYPKFGVWPDGYYYTANMFGSSFDGAMAGVFERDKMLNGQAAQFIWFFIADSNSFPSYSMLPADLDGANQPPAGAPNPVIELVDDAWGYDPPYDKDEIVINPLHVDWATPANSTFGPATVVDMTAAGYPFDTSMCAYNRDCIPQPDTSQGLDALSSRLMYRLQYRNFGGYQTLVASHTVDVDGSDWAGVRWYELRDSGAGWGVQQAGTYAPDSDNRWMGDAAMDTSGDIAVGYSVSSSTTYPSIRWAGRLAGDPAGSLSQGEATVIAGSGSQTHSAARWGDYSSMSVDPTDDCTFWYTQEYMPTTGAAPWQTRIAAFKFPGCSTGPTGTIQGTVTDSSTGDPLADATVDFVSSSGSFSTTTAPDGTYSITLPIETYDTTASKFGWVAQTVTGIVVGDGDVITQDFALVTAPTGAVDGYVTGADRGWPLYAKVQVKVGASTVATVFTDPFTGYYSLTLPAGTSYDFTATSIISGYLPKTVSVALTTSGQIVSFALDPDGTGPWTRCYLQNGVDEDFEGSFPPSGWKAVDNSGTGHVWARNDQLGAPNRTPGSGYSAAADPSAAGGGAWDTTLYSPEIELPATPALGVEFNSNFQDYAGNGDAWFEITSDGGATWTTLWYSSSDDPSGGLLRQFDLSAYAGQTIQLRWHYTCTSATAWYWQIDDVQTYSLPVNPPTPVQSEDFESWMPTGWTTTNNGGGCGTWESTATTGRTNYTGGSGEAADADSDWCGSAMDTDLLSPVYDLSSQTTVWIQFKYFFNYLSSGDQATFDYSTDGGATWTNVFTLTADDSGTFSQDMSSALAGQASVQFRWNYTASGWNWYYEIDDFEIYDADPAGSPPPPAPAVDLVCEPIGGAFVAGFVTDANTTDAMNGASIVTDNGITATSADTPEDPALPGGFYWMFVPINVGNGPSTRTFTVSNTGYADSVVEFTPIPETVNQLDFALAAGWLEVTPTHMEARLYSGETDNQILDIINHGGVDANVQLLAFEKAGWVPSMPMDEIPATSVPAAHLNDRTAQAANVPQHEAGAPLAAGDVISSWPTGLTYGWGVGVNKFADNLWVGNISAGGGDDLDYEYTRTGTQTGKTVDTSSWMGSFAGDMAFDSTNGTMWQLAVGGDNCIHEWDPATQTTTGNVICWGASTSERGLAYDPVSDTFFVGGWNTNAITRFDRSGTVLQTANVGLGISGLAYNPVTGHLFVQENSTADTITVLDPADNYNVLGSFTVAGMGGYAGAGLGFTCDGNLWLINQQTQTVYEVDSGEPGACLSATLPWFVTTPNDGVVPANEGDLPINGQFIADGAPHWGLVQGRVMILHDTPYQVDDVSLCLTKAFNDVPAGYWADAFIHSLAGAGISDGCGAGNFCPTDPMTRGVMARWLIKAMHGPDYSPAPCTGVFADVICESTPNSDYIEALYNEGVTAGCATNPLRYCPDSPVTRAQMSVFLLAAKEGSGYTPPPCTGIFTDVPCGSHWAADWVEELFNRGITAGCGPNIFCPNDDTSRDQMSVFMTVNWNFPMCNSGS